ncbi:DUF2207 family protein [Prevotella sp. ne3005]|uniref:DUF2207 family protein n=1 Tax=Prevotella sp. ne3005 TaxID=1761887 RepID=UPI000B867C32|nr:DUF2207 domain-containing protein [Prevotella sp. ne3005]
MKHLKSNICLLLVLLASATGISARPYLHSLDIRVVLSHNGDARITETRVMDIDDEGTECYIGLGNMGGSEVRDLRVSDEDGNDFENIGDWDIDESRSWKEYKCGIVYKHNGYELCWGLGESGSRTYTTSYTITSLVHAYPDADAIRHVFLDQDVSPKPDHAKISIEAEDSILFTDENCGIWGFRFGGELGFQDGRIIAYNTEDFGHSGAMYIMVRFNKGMFEPTIQEDDTFEHKKELAFEGSDYTSDDEWTTEDTIILLVMAICFFIVPIVGFIWYLIYVWRARKKVNKDLLWYRDIPMKGNLQQANDVLNAYKYFGTDYNNLLSACILKLIDMGAISIEQTLNSKGKTEQNFVIHELQNYADQPLLLRKIHSMFKTAAGEDTVLEPKELRSFMRSSKNESITDSFINTLHTKTSISYYKERFDDVRQVFGLKKFLKEFSLLDERHVNEVTLWKDYMIYATLFGIADQVIKDMKKINPEYFNMDQVAAQMANDTTLPMIYSTLHSGTSRAVANKAAREARASGHGGHSSWGGGGGGFSGGGFGGGVR